MDKNNTFSKVWNGFKPTHEARTESSSLYDSHVDSNVIKLLKKLNAFVQESLSDPELTEKQREGMTRFLEKIRTHKGVSKYDLDNLPKKMEQLFADLEKELSKEVTHVGRTYSSIELVHFCSNNEYDEVMLCLKNIR